MLHIRYQRGFTLIELLIAIVLSMIVLAGGYTIYQGSNRATTTQNLDLRMQDNARMAMDILAQNFRRTGFMVNWDSYPESPAPTAIEGVYQKLVIENHNTSPDAVSIVGGTLTTTTRLLIPAQAQSNTITVEDASAIKSGDVISVGLTYSGVVYGAPSGKVVTLDSTQPTGKLNMNYPGVYMADGTTKSDQSPALVRRLSTTRYYIKDDDPKHPVLMQVRQGKYGAIEEPIAEDIEDFQISYGYDADNDRIISNTEWRNNPTTGVDLTDRAIIERIRLIRVTIVARTSRPDPALVNVTQKIPAIEDRPERTNVTDGYRRFILTRIIKTRNLDILYTL